MHDNEFTPGSPSLNMSTYFKMMLILRYLLAFQLFRLFRNAIFKVFWL